MEWKLLFLLHCGSLKSFGLIEFFFFIETYITFKNRNLENIFVLVCVRACRPEVDIRCLPSLSTLFFQDHLSLNLERTNWPRLAGSRDLPGQTFPMLGLYTHAITSEFLLVY